VVAARALIALLALLGAGALAAPAAAAEDCVVIDDFSKGEVGQFPPGWKLRKDSGRGVYSIQEEGGRRFLHAASKGDRKSVV